MDRCDAGRSFRAHCHAATACVQCHAITAVGKVRTGSGLRYPTLRGESMPPPHGAAQRPN